MATQTIGTTKHSLIEDLLAIFMAALLISLGIYLLHYAGFVTGGIAGLALVLEKVTPLSFGQLFFLVNLPFYWLAWSQMGKLFTLKTGLAVAMVSSFTEWVPTAFSLNAIAPLYAAVLGGFLIGLGLLIVIRHQCSVGGFSILIVYLQKRFAINGGLVQMGLDFCIVTASFFLLSPTALLLSIIGAVTLNMVIAINHRPGRYAIV